MADVHASDHDATTGSLPASAQQFAQMSLDATQASSLTSERLGLSPVNRMLYASVSTYAAGLALGAAYGARTAGLRFRAENSHRLPTNKRGWYFYHKAKHTYILSASIREGNSFGFRLMPWVILFFGVEEAVDHRRVNNDEYNTDFLSTTVAGLTVAGAFSLWYKMPIPTAARMAKLGLMGGLGFGLTQDLLHTLRGHTPSYVVKIGNIIGLESDHGAGDARPS